MLMNGGETTWFAIKKRTNIAMFAFEINWKRIKLDTLLCVSLIFEWRKHYWDVFKLVFEW